MLPPVNDRGIDVLNESRPEACCTPIFLIEPSGWVTLLILWLYNGEKEIEKDGFILCRDDARLSSFICWVEFWILMAFEFSNASWMHSSMKIAFCEWGISPP